MTVFVVLLRAIGPATHKVMSMARWREAVAAAGFRDPRTVIATGNMIVEGEGTLATVTRSMNEIVLSLGLTEANVAVVRKPSQLQALVEANPFPKAATEHPGQIGVYFFVESKPDFGWISGYDGPERLHVEANHLIVDYPAPEGMRLPGVVERRSGTATARNWNTLRSLADKAMARQRGEN